DIGDVLASVGDIEGFAVVAGTLADLALDEDIGEEVHLDLLDALALAGLAAPAFHIETEAPDFVAADLGFAGLREGLADLVEHAGVGGGVGAGGAPDGGLVHFDDAVDAVQAVDAGVLSGLVATGGQVLA